MLVTPLLVLGASVLRSAVARADEKTQESTAPQSAAVTAAEAPSSVLKGEEKEEVISSRIYDATVIGEPLAVGKDKRKVWEKLMSGRIVYLGEAEQVPTRDDKELELQILKILQKRCVEAERPISLALEAFPSNLQEQLNQYMSGRYNLSSQTTFIALINYFTSNDYGILYLLIFLDFKNYIKKIMDFLGC